MGADHVRDAIHVGTGTYIGQFAWFSLPTRDARIQIGQDCQLNSNLTLSVAQAVTIGDAVGIGDRTTIIDHEHDPRGYLAASLTTGQAPRFDYGITEPQPVRIGSGVHIGMNVVILPGVEIGDGAIVGANAVVTRSVPPFTVVAGIPATVVRTITPDDLDVAEAEGA